MRTGMQRRDMSDGVIVEEAPPAEFFKNPRHERTRKFLGEILPRY